MLALDVGARGHAKRSWRSALSRQDARACRAPSAEHSHVARFPTTCSRAAPSTNLASHLRSGAVPAGAPRPRRQTMCFWGRRAPAAPIRCCTQTSCGRRRLQEKMNSLISFLLDFASSTRQDARACRAPSAEHSHVARFPTTCSRAAPSTNLASHLRSGALPAGAPRPRRQTMCFWGKTCASCANPLLHADVLWKTSSAGKK